MKYNKSSYKTKDQMMFDQCMLFLFTSFFTALLIYELWVANNFSNVAVLINSMSGSLLETLQSIAKPKLISLIFRYSLVLSVLLGFIYLFKLGHYNSTTQYRMMFWFMQFWMIGHSVAAFSFGPPPGMSEFHGLKGPMVWLACSMVFVGMDDTIWNLFIRLIKIYTFIVTIIILYKLLTFSGAFGQKIFRQYFYMHYISLIIWTAPFLVYNIEIFNIKISDFFMALVPFIVLGCIAFLAGGRSWILVLIMHIFLIFIKFKKHIIQKPKLFFTMIYILPLLICVIVYVNFEKINNVYTYLSINWSQDTRSDQYIQFFSQISGYDLVFGKGPRATWVWNGRPYPYIDGAFTLLAFNGGLPLVAGYILLIITPAFKLFFTKPSWQDSAPAIIIVFWTLAMMGLATFTCPKISYEHMLICMMAGRCNYLLHKKKD